MRRPEAETIGVVLLTTGRKPAELAAALHSLLGQRDVALDVVVVGNGWAPTGLPHGVRGLHLPVDEGIPAGRNAGIGAVRGELVFFLDDDARLRDDDALARVGREFAARPALGLLQLRVDPADGTRRTRDWDPRMRTGDPGRSGPVTAVWEGAVCARRAVLDEVGAWPANFRFVHEGVDLAWRVMAGGHEVRYAGDVVVLHPVATGTPHWYTFYFSARNKVFLARRHLPAWLGVIYVLGFALRTLPRIRRAGRGALRQALRGYRDGLRQDAGQRRTLPVNTLWRMTRAGRPPIL